MGRQSKNQLAIIDSILDNHVSGKREDKKGTPYVGRSLSDVPIPQRTSFSEDFREQEEIMADSVIPTQVSKQQRYCNACKVFHDVAAFGADKDSPDGVAGVCRDQKYARKRENRKLNVKREYVPLTKTIQVNFSKCGSVELHDTILSLADKELRSPEAQIIYMLREYLKQSSPPV